MILSLFPLAMGCASQEEEPIEFPLRPLLYTERPADESVVPPPGYEMWDGTIDPTAYPDEPPVLQIRRQAEGVAFHQVDLSTPEAVARAVFRALVNQDEELLQRTVLTPAEYSAAARTNLGPAQAHIQEVGQRSGELIEFFRGEIRSEQRPGGLGSMLQIESVVMTDGRLVTGAVARGNEQPVMYWGIEVRMRLFDTEQVFRLRFPKILQAPDGHWGLAEPPEVDGMLQLFVQMGFHLAPTMLSFEHYPYPLFTGNYWTYQVREVPRSSSMEADWGSGEAAVPEEPEGPVRSRERSSMEEPLPPLEPDQTWTVELGPVEETEEETGGPNHEEDGHPGEGERVGSGDVEEQTVYPRFIDEVVSREDYEGYSLVEIGREYLDQTMTPTSRYYVLTARRIYRCDRDCRRNIRDISWLLVHFSRRVPDLVFPLRTSMGWRTGGRPDMRGECRTRSRLELADTPAGRFESTVCISRSTAQGKEHRFFQPGIGVVLTRIDGSTSIRYEELVDYRIIP
ncbi:MAG: hypothetical protein JW797_04490 [Bradymonadales bacterium]|nr:hypothetical protein [Bradymonadales bacterium]